MDARLQYDISLKTSLAATTGYTHLYDSEIKGLGFVPAKIGLNHSLVINFMFWAKLSPLMVQNLEWKLHFYGLQVLAWIQNILI